MAIAFEGETDAFNDGTGGLSTVSINSDTGGTSDVLVAFAFTNGNGVDLTVTSVSGGSLTWTQRGSTFNDSTAHRYVYTSSQVTTSAAVSVTANLNRAVTAFSGQSAEIFVFRFSGVGTSPVDGSNSADSGQTTNVSGGSVTIDSGNASVLLVSQNNNFGQTYTPPSGYTEAYDGGNAKGCFYHLGLSGAQNPAAASTSNWFGSYGVHVELVPAAGGGAAARVVDRMVRPRGARNNSFFY